MPSSPGEAGTLKGDSHILLCERGREDACYKEDTMVTLGKVVSFAGESCLYLSSGSNTGTKNCGKS